VRRHPALFGSGTRVLADALVEGKNKASVAQMDSRQAEVDTFKDIRHGDIQVVPFAPGDRIFPAVNRDAAAARARVERFLPVSCRGGDYW
jgi:hypothetical protein